MKKSIYRIFSIMLIALLLITNLPVVFAESNASENYAFVASDEYKDANTVSGIIKEGMKAQKESITAYYQTDHVLTDNDIIQLMEMVFAETDQADEGDYLRFCWISRDINVEYYIDDNKYYNKLDVSFTYHTSAQQENELTLAVEKLIESFGFSDSSSEIEKAYKIYEYITDHVKYDNEHLNEADYWQKYSAYAALINKTAVCEGYALLFYRLAKECGLDARVIPGVGGEGGKDDNHAWNIVRIGDYYYYLDATWDSKHEESYKWYLKGKNDFPNHANDAKYNTSEFYSVYPIAESGFNEEILLAGAQKKEGNLLLVELDGASTFNLRANSSYGEVKIYADAEHRVAVSNNNDIKLDGGITKLFAVAPSKDGGPQNYEIEIRSPQYSAYTDKLTNWAKPYIEKLNQTGLGLFKGDEHGRFNGKKGLNRYEMAAVLLRLQGTNKDLFKNCENPFIDKIPSWALNYVKAAYKLGLIKGYEVKLSNKKVAYEFRGKNTATRNEFFRLFMNVVIGDIAPEYLGDINSYYEANKAKINAFVKAKGFKDAGKVANWAKPGTYTAIYFGYVNGTNDKKINPTTVITREAAATLIAQALA